jgi:hypothetical protein
MTQNIFMPVLVRKLSHILQQELNNDLLVQNVRGKCKACLRIIPVSRILGKQF